MTVNQSRLLAIALYETKPTDPVRKAHWIHAMRVLRDIVKQEIPAIDPDHWENLCYGPDEDCDEYNDHLYPNRGALARETRKEKETAKKQSEFMTAFGQALNSSLRKNAIPVCTKAEENS